MFVFMTSKTIQPGLHESKSGLYGVGHTPQSNRSWSCAQANADVEKPL